MAAPVGERSSRSTGPPRSDQSAPAASSTTAGTGTGYVPWLISTAPPPAATGINVATIIVISVGTGGGVLDTGPPLWSGVEHVGVIESAERRDVDQPREVQVPVVPVCPAGDEQPAVGEERVPDAEDVAREFLVDDRDGPLSGVEQLRRIGVPEPGLVVRRPAERQHLAGVQQRDVDRQVAEPVFDRLPLAALSRQPRVLGRHAVPARRRWPESVVSCQDPGPHLSVADPDDRRPVVIRRRARRGSTRFSPRSASHRP